MKKNICKKISLIIFIIITIFTIAGCDKKESMLDKNYDEIVKEQDGEILSLNTKAELKKITDDGSLVLNVKTKDLLESGLQYADMLAVRINNEDVDMPLVESEEYGDKGTVLMVADENKVCIIRRKSDFVSGFRLATKSVEPGEKYVWEAMDNINFPLNIEIKLKEKDGYKENYHIYEIKDKKKKKGE